MEEEFFKNQPHELDISIYLLWVWFSGSNVGIHDSHTLIVTLSEFNRCAQSPRSSSHNDHIEIGPILLMRKGSHCRKSRGKEEIQQG